VGQTPTHRIRLFRGESDGPLDTPEPEAEARAEPVAEAESEAESEAGSCPITVLNEQACQTFAALVEMGAGLVQCQAAVLYLIDDTNEQLTVAASWGLKDKDLHSSRPLRGARVDLEVLVGHVVTIHKPTTFPVKGRFKSAVCIPLAINDLPLGTLWIFSASKRSFSEGDLMSTELVTERLAREVDNWLASA
jgi:GAF domain-containing protein